MNLDEIIAALQALLENPNATIEEMAAAVAQAVEALNALTTPTEDEPVVEPAVEAQAVTLASLINKATARIEKKKANAAVIKSAINTPTGAQPMVTKTSNPVVTMKHGKSKVYKDSAEAYRVGKFLQATFGSEDAKKWCDQNGVSLKTLTSGSDANGGLFVPEEMESAIWNLKEEYGVFRGGANVVGMGSDTRKIMKEVSGNSVYFVGEGVAPTASDLEWQNITLSAKTLAVLTKYSKQLAEDATISIADEITQWAAYKLAQREDECGFIGDGTSTYGGIIGATYKYRKLVEDGGGTWATDADKANLGSAVVASGTTWSAITLSDVIAMVGKLAAYPGMTPAFHCTPQFYWNTLYNLAIAKNGTTATEVVNGVPTPVLLGYPVVLNNVMAKATATNQVPLLFGDVSASSYMGDRRGITIETSEHADFASRLVSVLVSERFDIVNHDFGNYTATAANREAGAMVGLITQND
jgi:HK97 family phage major capsid protein